MGEFPTCQQGPHLNRTKGKIEFHQVHMEEICQKEDKLNSFLSRNCRVISLGGGGSLEEAQRRDKARGFVHNTICNCILWYNSNWIC
mmetsp:Transcript_28500/g.37294  ORF Transcript_28500/g.37294 Transcript_28500/m.37294 type:complete len:87 (+) Transcript_28500:50-310(+)